MVKKVIPVAFKPVGGTMVKEVEHGGRTEQYELYGGR